MNNTNAILARQQGTSKIVRAKFGPGMLLQHEDLELLNTYTRDLSRIMFKSLFGCGVVCGLVVRTKTECGKVWVSVDSGVALACSGDPIWVPKNESFPIDENCDPELPSPLWVVLCAKVKYCAPRTAVCSPDDEETKPECTRERDGYEIQVIRAPRPPCVCGCPEEDDAYDDEWDKDCKCVNPNLECYAAHYAGKCGCDCDDCSDCDCKCVLLARLEIEGDTENWLVKHQFRRFVRPVLMRDPEVVPKREVEIEQTRMQKRVERLSNEGATEGVLEAAHKAGFEAGVRAAAKIVKPMGHNAAQKIMKEVGIEIVTDPVAEPVVRAEPKRGGRQKRGGLPPDKKVEKTAEAIETETPPQPKAK